jgi:mannose-6-phosphate isomerase
MQFVDKPWGHEIVWASTDLYLGKILHINAGQMISLHHHKQKDETLYVYRGKVDVLIEDVEGNMRSHTYGEASTFHIPVDVNHRIIAVTDAELLEVSTPFPDDLIRVQDKYGRV